MAERVTGHAAERAVTTEMTDEFGIPKGPNSQFYFGADAAGRDLFVRVMYGARTSLLVGIVASGLAVLIGTFIGVMAGFFGGWADTTLSRGADVMLAVPQLLISIGIVAACSTTKEGCAGGLIKPGLIDRHRRDRPLLVAVRRARRSWEHAVAEGEGVRRGEPLHRRRAARGSSRATSCRTCIAPIIVLATLLVPQSILFEAALSYLGLGVPPDQASWGQILADATWLYDVAWWLMIFPGAFLVVTTLAFNLLGDGLRDALDVRTDR